MAAAVVQMQVLHGATGAPTFASAESGVVLNRADNELATKPVPIPDAAPGSNYANYKSFQLSVVTPGDTTITNLAIRQSSAPDSGLRWFRGTVGAYAQCTGDGDSQGNRPPDSTAALAASPAPNTPAAHNPLTTTYFVYDADPYDSSISGPFGDVIKIVAGVSSAYGGDADAARALPALYYRYSES